MVLYLTSVRDIFIAVVFVPSVFCNIARDISFST